MRTPDMKSQDGSNYSIATIRKKLILAFFILSVVIGTLGAVSWSGLNRIESTVELFAGVAVPLADESVKLTENIQQTYNLSFDILRETDPELIDKHKTQLEVLSKEFDESAVRISKLCEIGGVNLEIAQEIKVYKSYVNEIKVMTELYLQSLIYGQEVAVKLSLYEEKSKSQLDLLTELNYMARASMNEMEEVSKTKMQAGDALAEEMGEMLELTFYEIYPLLESSDKLIHYCIEIKEIIGEYTIELNQEKLTECENGIAKRVKWYRSRQKRLGRRIDSEDAKAVFGKTEENFDELEKLIVQEGGLFETYRKLAGAKLEVKLLQETLLQDSVNCKNKILAAVDKSREVYVMTGDKSREVIAMSKKFQVVFTAVGILLSIIAGAIITRSITSSIAEL